MAKARSAFIIVLLLLGQSVMAQNKTTFSSEELASRTVYRRAVDAVIWGLPLVGEHTVGRACRRAGRRPVDATRDVELVRQVLADQRDFPAPVLAAWREAFKAAAHDPELAADLAKARSVVRYDGPEAIQRLLAVADGLDAAKLGKLRAAYSGALEGK